jgi:hypothetical protein
MFRPLFPNVAVIYEIGHIVDHVLAQVKVGFGHAIQTIGWG